MTCLVFSVLHSFEAFVSTCLLYVSSRFRTYHASFMLVRHNHRMQYYLLIVVIENDHDMTSLNKEEKERKTISCRGITFLVRLV
jgi:hypothetical protein